MRGQTNQDIGNLNIKKIFSQNDYAMIDEIITRRYSARLTLQQSNENDPTPDSDSGRWRKGAVKHSHSNSWQVGIKYTMHFTCKRK